MKPTRSLNVIFVICILASCSGTGTKSLAKHEDPPPTVFKVDPSTAGVLRGTVQFAGHKPKARVIDMSSDPACVEAHPGRAVDESVVVNPNGTLANVFVSIKSGLEGKTFEVPATPVSIDQHGCWFGPRVLGIRAGQALQVTNSDPVTHNIHPLAELNREWNHSQGPGDPPMSRKFVRPEAMIRVKCNIHNWMHAYIGVIDHPYFVITGATGTFEIRDVPPGDYVIQAWQETLGAQEQRVTVSPSSEIMTNFIFKGQ